MARKENFYLIYIQYLGYRYHGWAKQKNAKTVQEMFDKTIKNVFPEIEFKTLGAGRTDAMVSANEFAVELFSSKVLDPSEIYEQLKSNLPLDINVLRVQEVDKDFRVINDAKTKEYRYFFSNENQNYPLSAPYMVNFKGPLDIDLMKKGAKIFIGEHNFRSYCYRSTGNNQYVREVIESKILSNNFLKANFFPEKSYMYIVRGPGFLRYQIRIMIGTLVDLGAGKISLEDIRTSLNGESEKRMGFIAPSSGLLLNKLEYQKEENNV